jgi:hypothetical protein
MWRVEALHDQQRAVLAHRTPTIHENCDVTGHYENGIGTTDAATAGVITPQLIDDRPMRLAASGHIRWQGLGRATIRTASPHDPTVREGPG